jgi:hypothetical protein
MDDDPGIDLAAAAHLFPGRPFRKTSRTENGGGESQVAAIGALLNAKLPLLAGFPVSLAVLVGEGKRFFHCEHEGLLYDPRIRQL